MAAFLREHAAELDKARVGEYFGHHEDFEVAVMHAWVDMQPSWAGIPIDSALRLLLEQFRLPGERGRAARVSRRVSRGAAVCVCVRVELHVCDYVGLRSGFEEWFM